jgi:tetratricopeptide (TPR) repeat protein
VATISELWVEKSDQNGMVRVESKAGMRFPVSIVVSARGYQTRQLLMTSSRFENLEVNLPRLENTPHSGMTVSLSELSPENQATSTSFQQKAIQALQQGDHIRAEQLLRKAIELTPSIGMLYNNLGVAVLRQGRMGEAITWFEKAYEMSPYDGGTNGNLGLMRWMQKRTDESYQLLDKAVALGFSTPTAHYYLGILALARGQWKLSVEQLSRTDGNRFRYRDLFLAQALSGMGRQKESLNSFQKHMSRNPVHYYIYVPSYRTQTAADLSSPLQSQPSANAHILPH